MKIMLTTPPAQTEIHSGMPKIFYDLRGVHPPMGLLYISSYLKKKKGIKNVSVYDIRGDRDGFKQAIKKIKNFSPDIIGVQMFTMTASDVVKFLKSIKKMDSSIKTIVGGAHPTIFPKETISLNCVDYIILGEGERAFSNLVKNIEKGNPYPKIKSVGFKNGEEIYLNRESNKINDLDSIPLVDRSVLNLEKYKSSFSCDKRITSIVTSRGCPYNCIFCAKFQKKFRAHSPEYVVNDIEQSLELGIEEIFVVDDTFSLDLSRAKKICRLIIERKLDFNWYISTRVDTVDKELLQLLNRAGCKQINYGIESGSQKIIDNLNKGIDLEKAKETIRKTKEAGIQVLCYFMIGLPGETSKELNETRKFIKEADIDFVRFSVTTLEPATKLYSMALNRGVLKKDIWLEFAKNPTGDIEVPVWDENFSKEELNNFLAEFSKKHYLNPKFLIKSLLDVRSPKELIYGLISFFKLLKL